MHFSASVRARGSRPDALRIRPSSRRAAISFALAMVSVAVGGVGTASAVSADNRDRSRDSASFALPNGFQPEGIDIGPRQIAYLGSLADGSIYRADLRKGEGEVFSPAVGKPAVGLEADNRGRLFVSGGPSGTARVIDTDSGVVLAEYQLATKGASSFINDVVVTRDAAWFTDSVNPVLYRVPLGAGGRLPAQDAVVAVPLTGELVYDADPATFEANGIETTPDRSALLVVQSRTGSLFRVEPASGKTTLVDLGGYSLVNGDGLTRDRRTLFAVQNRLNQVAVLKLSRDGRSGALERIISDPAFDVPTTIGVTRHQLFLPNARFGTPSPATATYSVTAVSRD